MLPLAAYTPVYSLVAPFPSSYCPQFFSSGELSRLFDRLEGHAKANPGFSPAVLYSPPFFAPFQPQLISRWPGEGFCVEALSSEEADRKIKALQQQLLPQAADPWSGSYNEPSPIPPPVQWRGSNGRNVPVLEPSPSIGSKRPRDQGSVESASVRRRGEGQYRVIPESNKKWNKQIKATESSIDQKDLRGWISCLENLPNFDIVNCSTAIHTLAKYLPDSCYADFFQNHAEELNQIVKKILEIIDTAEPLSLSNLAWGFGKLNITNQKLMEKIAEEAKKEGKIQCFNPQGLSNLAWGCARLNFNDQNLMEAIAKEAKKEKKIEGFKPQELSNLAWACAKLNFNDQDLIRTIAREAEEKIEDFKPQELSSLAWACAKLNVNTRDLMQAISKEAERKIKNFKPQGLSNLAWAYATLDANVQGLMRALAEEVKRERKIQYFNPQELSNLAWSCARLNFNDQDLMRLIAREAKGKIKDFNDQGLSNLSWACAKLNVNDQDLMRVIAEKRAIIRVEEEQKVAHD